MNKTNEQMSNESYKLTQSNHKKGYFISKKTGKRIATVSLAFLLGTSVLTPVKAAISDMPLETIEVTKGIDMFYSDLYYIPTDVKGKEVNIFKYAGTNYLPLRSLSNTLGFDIKYDSVTNTVNINTKVDKETSGHFSADQNKKTYNTSIEVRKDVKILIDGELFIPRDEKGNQVPTLYVEDEKTVFASARAIATRFGLNVNWNKEWEAITVGEFNQSLHNINSEPIPTEPSNPAVVEYPNNGNLNVLCDEYLKYLSLMEGYSKTVYNKGCEINNKVNAATSATDSLYYALLEGEIVDPVLQSYMDEFQEIAVALAYKSRDMLALDVSMMRADRQKLLGHIRSGNYEQWEMDTLLQETKDLKDNYNNIDSILAEVSSDKIDQQIKLLNNLSDKIIDYQKQKKLVLK